MKTVVIFVDSKSRDLMGDALIAHHLEKRGVRCILEPLASWRACVGAWKPDFILFNHLNSAHLAQFSQQLNKCGILTGILLNEGIFYIEGTLEYNSQVHYKNMHCDLYLSWNVTHLKELIKNKVCASESQIVAVGVPRFDFYKEPWNKVKRSARTTSGRPVILMNSNFSIAHFHELPDEDGDRLFGQWKDKVPIYGDYRNAIIASHKGQSEFPQFIEALIAEDKYEIIVRPHPREESRFYLNWYEQLASHQQKHVCLAMKEEICDLILSCDLEISCENCTTTLEAWLAGKPSVGLTFEKHPFFYTPEIGSMQPECDQPSALPELVKQALADPDQPEVQNTRKQHIEKWVFKADGQSSARTAESIIHALDNTASTKKIKLSFPNKRRGIKLRLLSALNEPSNTQPKHFFKHLIFGKLGKPTIRYKDYLKAIRPSDVRNARESIKKIDP